METQPKVPEYLMQKSVLARHGWSTTLVRQLLGEPDSRKKIPGRTNPLCLYAMERVLAAEAGPAFQEAQARLAKRKAAGGKAAETKKRKLMDAVRAMQITVARVGVNHARRLAIDHYNQRHPGDCFADSKSDPAFLERITVNYIRHHLTEYDQALWDVAGKTGIRCAVVEIRKRIYSAIAEAYPSLAPECDRQLAERT